MKEKLKKIYDFVKKPNMLFSCISYVLFFAFAVLTIIFLAIDMSSGLMIVCYASLGVTFFYDLYLFIVYDYKKLKAYSKQKFEALTQKSKVVNRFTNDIYFRTMTTSSFSLFWSFCFVAYNAFAGLYYHSMWNGSIAIYYGFLVGIRILFLFGEYKIAKGDFSQECKEIKRAKMFRLEGILLLCLNIVLVVPITMLALQKKEVNLPMWVAIVNATYTFYKMTMCAVAYFRTRKNDILSIRGLKKLNLTDAFVSLLSLENTMIITFSNEQTGDMSMLMIISCFVVLLVNVWIALSTYLKGKSEVLVLEDKIV